MVTEGAKEPRRVNGNDGDAAPDVRVTNRGLMQVILVLAGLVGGGAIGGVGPKLLGNGQPTEEQQARMLRETVDAAGLIITGVVKEMAPVLQPLRDEDKNFHLRLNTLSERMNGADRESAQNAQRLDKLDAKVDSAAAGIHRIELLLAKRGESP